MTMTVKVLTTTMAVAATIATIAVAMMIVEASAKPSGATLQAA